MMKTQLNIQKFYRNARRDSGGRRETEDGRQKTEDGMFRHSELVSESYNK